MRLLAIAVLLSSTALARDNGQWTTSDALVSRWYQSLKQPDHPRLSCCGEADAYHADGFEVQGDQYIAIITDTREDAPLGRPHIPPGTKVVVPANKLKWDAGNPTGHGVIFIGTRGQVYCYVTPGGA
jgi:hypothetical protein